MPSILEVILLTSSHAALEEPVMERPDSPALDSLLPQIDSRLRPICEFSFHNLCNKLTEALTDIEKVLLLAARDTRNEAEKEVLIHAIHEVQKHQAALCEDFKHELLSAFHLLSNKQPQAQLSDNEKSLVSQTTINERIVVQKIIADGQRHYDIVLKQILASLQYALPNNNISANNNPVGPNVIAETLFHGLELLNIESLARQVLMKHYQQRILFDMKSLYQELIRALKAANILDIHAVINPFNTEQLQQQAGFKLDTVDSEPSLLAHEQLLAANTSSHHQTGTTDVISLLQGSTIPTPNNSDNVSVNHLRSETQQLSRAALLELLIDHQKAYDPSSDGELMDLVSRQLTLAESQKVLQLQQEDENVINLICLIFNDLIKSLAKEHHNLVLRLKVPYCRLALSDELFFHDNLHPARELLDSMLAYLTVETNTKSTQKQLQLSVSKIVLRFDGSSDIFTSLLAHWHKLEQQRVDKATAAANLNAKKPINAVATLVAQRFDVLPLQLPFHQLTASIWRKILAEISLHQDKSARRRQTALILLDKTIQFSGFYHGETLKQQAKELPRLAALLQKLFTEYAISDMKQQIFLAQLQDIQLQLVQGVVLADIDTNNLPQAALLKALLKPELESQLEVVSAQQFKPSLNQNFASTLETISQQLVQATS